MNLNGKHALVTGGGTGIGLAIARALAADGAKVTITGRRSDVLEDVAGNGLFAMAMDVRDETDVKTKIADAVAARGPVQICVANAGIAEASPLHKTSLDFWRDMMATNLDGAFLTIRESLQSMLTTDWGRVISISSIAGVRGMKGLGAYCASKHGLVGLTKSLSEDYLGKPFTFNAICPAYVDTPIIEQNTQRISARGGLSPAQAQAVMVDENPHKRLILPDEIAAAAMWLVGPGSQSVNGETIRIAGGQV